MTSKSKSYLITTWEGGGNVPPVLGLAKSLLKKGHTVHILAEPCINESIDEIGAHFIPFKNYFTRTDRSIDLIKDWNAKPWHIPSIENILVRPAQSVAEETTEALKQTNADVLIADFMMPGALIAAEALGIKRVALFHMPEYLPGSGRPPGGMGLLPSSSAVGKIRDSLLSKAFYLVLKQYLAPLNKVRENFGLSRHQSVVDCLHEANLRLIQTSEAFDSPITPAPDNVRYVGPVLDDPAWVEATDYSPYQSDSRPLVIVSLSSTFQNQKSTLENIISAFKNINALAIVTLGPAMEKETFHPPENVHLVSSAPHSQLFPIADAVITHAGHGTLMRALSHGLPLVCLPMGRDQLDNATLTEHHGGGIKLSNTASAGKINKAIKRILSEDHFKQGAQSLQKAILKDEKENRAVRHLEELADT